MSDRWIGFTQPVRLAAEGQGRVYFSELLRMSAALAAVLASRYGRAAITDMTPRATLGDVAPYWPQPFVLLPRGRA